MQRLSLENRLDRIGQHTVRARLFLDLWSYFSEEKTYHQIIDVMRDYNEFFRFAPHAFLATYIIYIAGIFERRNDTINLPLLISNSKKSSKISDRESAEIDRLILQAKPIADKITILRHNAFAHRNANVSYNDVFRQADVSPDQFRELTDLTLNIVNRLLQAHGMRNQYFTDLPQRAAESMMVALGGNRNDGC